MKYIIPRWTEEWNPLKLIFINYWNQLLKSQYHFYRICWPRIYIECFVCKSFNGWFHELHYLPIIWCFVCDKWPKPPLILYWDSVYIHHCNRLNWYAGCARDYCLIETCAYCIVSRCVQEVLLFCIGLEISIFHMQWLSIELCIGRGEGWAEGGRCHRLKYKSNLGH